MSTGTLTTGTPTPESEKIDTQFRIIHDNFNRNTELNYYYIMNNTGDDIVRFDESLDVYLSKFSYGDDFGNTNEDSIQKLINNLRNTTPAATTTSTATPTKIPEPQNQKT